MKCSVCQKEKPDSDFSKAQLKKGADAKCSQCVSQAEPSNDAGAPSKSTKVCASCGRSGVQFSKAQQKKDDGRCVECIQKNEAEPQKSPSVTSESKGPANSPTANPSQKKADITAETDPEAKSSPRAREAATSPRAAKPKPSSPRAATGEDVEDGDDEDTIRMCCESCQVYKPASAFQSDSRFCTVCADAKRRGVRSTTMKDHGFVASDGTSHRKLSWVPENLKEFLVFMEEEGQQAPEGHEEQEEPEDDDPYA